MFGTASAELCADGGIIAGCSCATALAKLSLVTVLRQALAATPIVRIKLWTTSISTRWAATGR